MKSHRVRTSHNRPLRSISWLLASAVAFPVVFPSTLRADVTWDPSVSSGDWNTSSNWLGGTLPSNSDNIFIAFNDAVTTHAITYDGTISSSGNLFLGNTGTGNVTLSLPPGFDFSVFNEVVGNSSSSIANHGTAIMDQSGATNSPFNLFVGFNSASTGIYNLSGSTSLLTSVAEMVGYSGLGIFNHSDGTNTVSRLVLGQATGSVGVYNLTGTGTLITTTRETIGASGFGTFNQTGGTHSVASLLLLAAASSATGGYTLNGASALLSVNGSTYIGGSDTSSAGSGVFNVQNGTMAVTKILKIWDTPGSAFNLSGGLLSVGTLDTTGNPSRFLGDGITTGWTSGSLALTGASGLTIDSSGPLGNNLSLTTQTLSVASDVYLGNTVSGVITQSGSSHNIGGVLYLGTSLSSTGVYSLSGTAALNTTGGEQIGAAGFGTFNQTGGTHTVGTTLTGQNLYLGFAAGAAGAYNFGPGKLSVNGSEIVGNAGSGTFNQTDGTHAISTNLSLAAQSGATGGYTLNGAAALLTVNNSSYIGGTDSGAGGAGIFNIQNGAFSSVGKLKVWDTPNTAVNLSGGLLNTGTLDTSGNPSRFNWSAGTLAVTGPGGLAIDTGAPLGPTLTLNSTKVLNVTNTLTNNGTLTLNGGAYQIGGLANNGTLNYQNTPTITGSVTNSGTISGLDGAIGSLTVSTLQLNAGGTLKFDLAAPGTSDELVVLSSNGLNLAGATTINLTNLGSLAVGTYTLLDYTGTLDGLLGNLTVGTAPGGFTYSLQNDTGNTAIDLVVGNIPTTAVWLGGTGNWSNGTFWSTGVSPNSASLHVQIDNANAAASVVTLDQNATVADVILDADDTLSINATQTLTLAGPNTSSFNGALNNAGTLAITGGAALLSGGGTHSGAFAISSGATLAFAGGTHEFSAFNISGPGTMSLTGGTLHISSANPTLGGPAAASSIVSMTGGIWNSDSSEIIGDSGAAAFSQSAGVHTNNGMSLGNSATGNGTYLLSGGTLNSTAPQFIGPVGTGTFTLNGATAVANLTSIYIGGTNLTGGGTGIVTIQSGTMNASGTFKIWDTGSSAVSLSGGVLSVGTLDTTGNPSRFNWSAGKLAITGPGGLAIGTGAALGPSLALNAPQSLAVTNTLTNNGTLILNGGSLQTGALNNTGTLNYQASTAVTGTVTNSGIISGQNVSAHTLMLDSLTLNTGGQLNFGLAAPGTSDEILVLSSNGLTLAGATTINLTNFGGLAAGTYALVDYSGTFAGLLTNLSVLNAPSGFNYALQNDTGNTAIDLVVTAQQAGTPGIWLGGTGNWSDSTKWTNNTIPNDSSFHVQIDSANAAASVVTLDQNATIADVTVDADDTLTISPTQTLTLAGPNTSTFSGVLNNAGTLALTGSAILNNNGAHAGAFALAAATLDFHAGTHTLSSTSSFSGTGTLAFTGATINADHLTLGQSATDNLTLNQTAGSVSIGTLAIGNDGTLTGGSGTARVTLSGGTLAATSILIGSSTGGSGQLTITGTAHVETNSLAIAPSGTTFAGTLDLTNRSLIVHAGNINDLTTLVKSGYNAGTWNGSGITTSTAPANPGQGIGLITGADYLTLNASPTFNGTTVAPSDVLLKYTYQGDADLDGYITMDDYAMLEAGFLFGNFDGVTNIATWVHGDFNYDGIVNYQDYALIDAAFQTQSGSLANGMIEQHALEFGAPYLQALNNLDSSPVPEPATLSLLFLASPMLLRRKRPI